MVAPLAIIGALAPVLGIILKSKWLTFFGVLVSLFIFSSIAEIPPFIWIGTVVVGIIMLVTGDKK